MLSPLSLHYRIRQLFSLFDLVFFPLHMCICIFLMFHLGIFFSVLNFHSLQQVVVYIAHPVLIEQFLLFRFINEAQYSIKYPWFKVIRSLQHSFHWSTCFFHGTHLDTVSYYLLVILMFQHRSRGRRNKCDKIRILLVCTIAFLHFVFLLAFSILWAIYAAFSTMTLNIICDHRPSMELWKPCTKTSACTQKTADRRPSCWHVEQSLSKICPQNNSISFVGLFAQE